MALRFERDGISFSYPENWQHDLEEADGGWTLSLQSPDTPFLLISHYEETPQLEEIAEATLEAMRAEYPDLEADEVVESLAGQMAMGNDIRFFSLDLTNTCWTRCFYGPYGTVLVMWQAADLDLEKHGDVLKAICASIKVEENGELSGGVDVG